MVLATELADWRRFGSARELMACSGLVPKGTIRQSNRTDNDSAKTAIGKGVIQGYTGVAAVDDRTQIIVVAQAHGTGSEHELLVPIVDALATIVGSDFAAHGGRGLSQHSRVPGAGGARH